MIGIMPDYTKKLCWGIGLLSLLVLVPFLGESLFYSKGEPREAIVALSMLQSGNWTLPLNYGTDIAYKPPFLYWAIATLSLPGGEVTEFTSRLPSALAFVGMQVFFFLFVARRRGWPTALLASLMLLTSFEVHRAAVACRVDMVQVSAIVVSLCLLYRWDERGCRRVPWAAIALMGIASLTKGPVGSIFPCLVIGVYQLLRGCAFFKAFWRLAGIGLASLVPLLLWYWMAYRQGGQPFLDLVLEENTGRFLGKMTYESHENPVWYNFLTLIWGWIPWTLVLLASLFNLKHRSIHLLPQADGWRSRLAKLWQAFRTQPPVRLFTWLTILIIFVFYCIPKSKRSVYLLPIYPFMAVLMADYLLALARGNSRKLLGGLALFFASLGLLLTLAFAVVRLGWLPDTLWGTGRHAGENIAFVHALRDTSYSWSQWLLILLPLVAACCLWQLIRRPVTNRVLLQGIAGGMLCLFVALDGVYQPTVLSVKSDKHLADRILQYVPQGPVYSYAVMSFYCTNYYLNDRMRHIEKEDPAEGYLIVAEKEEEEMHAALAGRYRLEKVFRTERRSCDMRDEICLYRFTR